MFDPEKTGTRIKKLRMDKGLTQQELADALKVKRESINTWENGTRELKATPLMDIANFFGVSSDYLLGSVDYRSPQATVQGICKETGLLSEAVDVLLDMKTDAVDNWPNPFIYSESEQWFPDWKQRKEGVYKLLNALLDRDELLEDFFKLAEYIDAVAAQNATPSDDAAENAAVEGPYTLKPHEMKEYREYLVIEQARRFAFKAMQKLAVPKTGKTAMDIRGAEWFYKIKAEGGEP